MNALDGQPEIVMPSLTLSGGESIKIRRKYMTLLYDELIENTLTTFDYCC